MILLDDKDTRCDMPTLKVEYRAEVEAPAEKLWDILADVKSWPEWQGTSYIEPPDGPLQQGSTFVVELGGLRWNTTVTEADRPKRLVWEARRKGLRAIHEWDFVEAGERTTALTRESMSGWMLLFTYWMAQKRLRQYNEKWLNDLKSTVESGLV